MRLTNAVICGALAFAAAAPAPAQQPKSVAAQPAPFAAVDRAFADFRSKTPVPGIAYGVVIDGKLVHVAYEGVRENAGKAPVDAKPASVSPR